MTDTQAKATAQAEQGKQAKAQTIQDILAAKKPNVRSVDILLDTDLARQIDAKEKELANIRLSKGRSLADGIGPLESELDALRAEASEHTATFTFRDIGRKAFEDLILQHPPTDDQKKQTSELGGGVLEYNLETFPPTLISATAIEPEITPDDAQQIFDEWGTADVQMLFLTALQVCTERANVPLSRVATAATKGSN